jgi:hypothetical protein
MRADCDCGITTQANGVNPKIRYFMTRWVFFLFFIALSLDSCSTSQESHWISRSELFPASHPNIKSIELKDGSILEFDRSLGWYDKEKQVIEGVNIAGGYDTTALAKIQGAEIVVGSGSSTGKSILTAFLILLGLAVVASIVFIIVAINDFSHSGCLVLIELGLASAATMAAVLIFIFV